MTKLRWARSVRRNRWSKKQLDKAGTGLGVVLKGALTVGTQRLVGESQTVDALAAPVIDAAVLTVLEVARRQFTSRELDRMGSAVRSAEEMVAELRAAGRKVRGDTFFDTTSVTRSSTSSSSALVEGVLLAASRSFEEKKVRHLGRLMGRIPFEPDIDAALANSLIGIAERLTWRQYVLLAVIGQDDSRLPPGEMMTDVHSWTAWGVNHDLTKLSNDGYITGPEIHTDRLNLFAGRSVKREEQRLTNSGQLLYELLSLAEVAAADVHQVEKSFDRHESSGPNVS